MSKTKHHAILDAISDGQMMDIINCIREKGKSMNDIIKETEISRTTVHRKIQSMIKNKLIEIENFAITPDGKKSKLFRTRLKSIKIKYEGNNMFVIIEEVPNIVSKIAVISHTQNKSHTDIIFN
jgi:predicted transcriptional regulator